ncbi:MAG: amino acid ABC transporter substrate-binding protein [Candidatus Rokubacteria bacterium]|nr:amino acid ABC transporter substrate-binding protein [Candidatus Rokubacteria bacterium]MBI3454672.1 amino acid ABC transporter substrate-binding protein [Candidatus Rokubacteria bacterium]
MSRSHEPETGAKGRVSRRKMLMAGGGVAIASTLVTNLMGRSVAHAQAQTSGKPLLDEILDRKELRVGTFLQYPPIMFKDKNGEPQGFEVDMARDMGQALGVKVAFVDSAWEGLLPGIQAGKFDVIIAQMAITAERAKVIHFCKPFEATGLVVVVSPKAPLTDASDVKAVAAHLNKPDKKVVVQLGSVNEKGKKIFFPSAQTITIQNLLDGYLQVSTGRADAYITDDVSALSYLKEHPGSAKVTLTGRKQPYLINFPAGGGVPRGQVEFAHWVDIFVQNWIDSGDYRRTYVKDIGWEPPLEQLQLLRGGF